MTVDDPRSRFERIEAELRALGICLKRLPGEYCVNIRYGGDKTARMADDLDQALEIGRAMAAEAAANRVTRTRRRRRWRTTNGKAPRRRFIHRRKRRVRAPRRQSGER